MESHNYVPSPIYKHHSLIVSILYDNGKITVWDNMTCQLKIGKRFVFFYPFFVNMEICCRNIRFCLPVSNTEDKKVNVLHVYSIKDTSYAWLENEVKR